MKPSFCIVILFLSIQLHSQKTIEKTIDAQNISFIMVEGNEMFKIKLNTSRTEKIILKTKIEGEYSEDMVVLANIEGDSVIVSSAFQPLFVNHNDKLSAHKVISIEIELIVPENRKVYIESNTASAEIDGDYDFLTAELSQGNCDLNIYDSNAIVNTVNGEIELNTNFADVEAFSKTGTVAREQLTLGSNQISLNSVNGNISIIKTKK